MDQPFKGRRNITRHHSAFFYQCSGGVSIILIFLLLIVFLIHQYQRDNNYYALSASFSNVEGLQRGSSVQLSGISIGYVENFRIDANYLVHVTMYIKKKFFIPKDSRASIYSSNLTTSKYITITPGVSNCYLKNGQAFLYTQDSISLLHIFKLLMHYRNKYETKHF